MNELGNKISKCRKDLGLTQTEFAERLSVTRQTVGRWEAGTVLPDIDRIGEIAALLGVSCDYLLRDEITEDRAVLASGVIRLLQNIQGKSVRLTFFDGEADIDLYDVPCTVLGFEGNWMKVAADLKKGRIEKLLPLSSVRAIELIGEAE